MCGADFNTELGAIAPGAMSADAAMADASRQTRDEREHPSGRW